ncbi:MAG: polyprenyl synthetase family protein [Acidimicrobiales bacterium]
MSTPTALTIPGEAVEARLTQALTRYRAEWSTVDPLLAETVDVLEHLVLSGGKRVRPAMAHWGYVAGGGDPTSPALADLGAALELLQGFALFHDDVMDGSATRRGLPTAHVREIERHQEAGWRGEPRRYGEAVAILAGDVALVLADVMLASVPPLVRSLWNDLRVEVNLGQFLDVVGTVRGDVPLATSERIVEYKTARYTIVRPLQMGAALAGADHLIEQLHGIGTPIGIGFQLRDDLLGAFGETEVTGKPVGDDLREAKPTPLLATAVALATPNQLDILRGVGPGLDDSGVARVQRVLHDTGAVDTIEAQIRELTAVAHAAIAAAPLAADAGDKLTELATFLADRSH